VTRSGSARVLITGASGFVGRAVSAGFESAGHLVTGTSTSGRDSTTALNLNRPGQIARALEESRPDLIIHLAGFQSVRDSWEDPDGTFRVNTGGTAALLREVERKVPEAHFVLASTAAVYGHPPVSGAGAPGGSTEEDSPGDAYLPFSEADPMKPGSPYAASKAAAEVLALEAAARTGMPVTIVRLFNQIGPGQPAAQVPAGFAAAVARAETAGESRVELEVGDPAKARDFTDTRDTARALRLIAEQRTTGRLNICGGQTHSLGRVIEGLSRLTGIEVVVKHVPERSNPNDVPVIGGSPERLEQATGWKPEVTLDESLAGLLETHRALLKPD
jgi:GDP-4-dehydro-6-deoxy-D-mannose reductase